MAQPAAATSAAEGRTARSPFGSPIRDLQSTAHPVTDGSGEWVLQRHGAPISALAPACLWDRTVYSRMPEWFNCVRSAGVELGLGLVLLSPRRVVARLGPLESPRHSQPMGLLHGGVSALVAEEMGSIAAAVNMPTPVVGVNLAATHLASARMGDAIIAVAEPLKLGRRLQVWSIDLYVDDEPADVLAQLGVVPAPDGSVDSRALYYRNHKPKGRHLATCQLTTVAQPTQQKPKAALPSKL